MGPLPFREETSPSLYLRERETGPLPCRLWRQPSASPLVKPKVRGKRRAHRRRIDDWSGFAKTPLSDKVGESRFLLSSKESHRRRIDDWSGFVNTPPFDFVKERQVLLPFREETSPSFSLREREKSSSRRSREETSPLPFQGRDEPLLLTSSKRSNDFVKVKQRLRQGEATTWSKRSDDVVKERRGHKIDNSLKPSIPFDLSKVDRQELGSRWFAYLKQGKQKGSLIILKNSKFFFFKSKAIRNENEKNNS